MLLLQNANYINLVSLIGAFVSIALVLLAFYFLLDKKDEKKSF